MKILRSGYHTQMICLSLSLSVYLCPCVSLSHLLLSSLSTPFSLVKAQDFILLHQTVLRMSILFFQVRSLVLKRQILRTRSFTTYSTFSCIHPCKHQWTGVHKTEQPHILLSGQLKRFSRTVYNYTLTYGGIYKRMSLYLNMLKT